MFRCYDLKDRKTLQLNCEYWHHVKNHVQASSCLLYRDVYRYHIVSAECFTFLSHVPTYISTAGIIHMGYFLMTTVCTLHVIRCHVSFLARWQNLNNRDVCAYVSRESVAAARLALEHVISSNNSGSRQPKQQDAIHSHDSRRRVVRYCACQSMTFKCNKCRGPSVYILALSKEGGREGSGVGVGFLRGYTKLKASCFLWGACGLGSERTAYRTISIEKEPPGEVWARPYFASCDPDYF